MQIWQPFLSYTLCFLLSTFTLFLSHPSPPSFSYTLPSFLYFYLPSYPSPSFSFSLSLSVYVTLFCRVSYSPDRLQTWYIAEKDLEFLFLLSLSSYVLGIQVYTTMPTLCNAEGQPRALCTLSSTLPNKSHPTFYFLPALLFFHIYLNVPLSFYLIWLQNELQIRIKVKYGVMDMKSKHLGCWGRGIMSLRPTWWYTKTMYRESESMISNVYHSCDLFKLSV